MSWAVYLNKNTQLTLSRNLGIFSFYPTYAIAKFGYFLFLPNLRYRAVWVFFLFTQLTLSRSLGKCYNIKT